MEEVTTTTTTTTATTTPRKMRIFVGGLGESVTEEDLRKIFGSLGVVEGMEIIRTKGRSFAYVDFSPSSLNSLPKLFSTYNGCAWKGGKLKLEKAKEHYLELLKRERAEDAKLGSKEPSKSLDANEDMDSSEKPKKLLSSAKKQLQIYFPSLRKVKSVPFSGTGKHKYSFQRVEVPSLPIHFCDCEEHSVTPQPAKGKQTCDLEAQNGGVNEEELNIMNSVMNKLFEREKVPDAAHIRGGLAKETDNSIKSIDGFQFDENEEDSATDEDNLIINVVTRRNNNRMALIGSQEKERISEDQEFNGTQISKDGQLQNALKVQKKSNGPPNKRRKSLLNQESDENGSMSTIPGGKGSSQVHLDESAKHLGARPAKPESAIQKSAASISWSQRSSWRQLVGDRGNRAFSVSHILPGSASSEEGEQGCVGPNVPASSEEGEQGCVGPNVPASSEEGEPRFVSPNVPASSEEGEPRFVDPNVPASSEEGEPRFVDPNVPASREEGEPRFVGPNVPAFTNCKNDNLVSHEDNLEGQSGETIIEGLAEAQPAKSSAASNNTGRGSSWLQRSSWTQLVSQSNNSSFSIAQILPGVSYKKQVLTNSNSVDVVDSTDCKLKDLGQDADSKSTGDGFITLGISKKEGDVARSTPEKNQRTFLGNDEAPAPILEKKQDSASKRTCATNTTIGESCSFMRSATSLKEWAKTKAAVSGSLKRKSSEK